MEILGKGYELILNKNIVWKKGQHVGKIIYRYPGKLI